MGHLPTQKSVTAPEFVCSSIQTVPRATVGRGPSTFPYAQSHSSCSKFIFFFTPTPHGYRFKDCAFRYQQERVQLAQEIQHLHRRRTLCVAIPSPEEYNLRAGATWEDAPCAGEVLPARRTNTRMCITRRLHAVQHVITEAQQVQYVPPPTCFLTQYSHCLLHYTHRGTSSTCLPIGMQTAASCFRNDLPAPRLRHRILSLTPHNQSRQLLPLYPHQPPTS